MCNLQGKMGIFDNKHWLVQLRAVPFPFIPLLSGVVGCIGLDLLGGGGGYLESRARSLLISCCTLPLKLNSQAAEAQDSHSGCCFFCVCDHFQWLTHCLRKHTGSNPDCGRVVLCDTAGSAYQVRMMMMISCANLWLAVPLPLVRAAVEMHYCHGNGKNNTVSKHSWITTISQFRHRRCV